jgi:cytochrome oxidase assembly protein ShyY1
MHAEQPRPRGAHRARPRRPSLIARALQYAVVWIVLVWLAAAVCWELAQQLMGIH